MFPCAWEERITGQGSALEISIVPPSNIWFTFCLGSLSFELYPSKKEKKKKIYIFTFIFIYNKLYIFIYIWYTVLCNLLFSFTTMSLRFLHVIAGSYIVIHFHWCIIFHGVNTISQCFVHPPIGTLEFPVFCYYNSTVRDRVSGAHHAQEFLWGTGFWVFYS